MSNTTHFEISRTLVYKLFSVLFTCIIALCIYVYNSDETITRASLKSNQQAIQRTLDGMTQNEKGIAVGETRMDGHVVNPVAHN